MRSGAMGLMNGHQRNTLQWEGASGAHPRDSPMSLRQSKYLECKQDNQTAISQVPEPLL